jgi:hypothetical protein
MRVKLGLVNKFGYQIENVLELSSSNAGIFTNKNVAGKVFYGIFDIQNRVIFISVSANVNMDTLNQGLKLV